MTPVRSVLFASAISLATSAAFAGGDMHESRAYPAAPAAGATAPESMSAPESVFERLDTNNDDRIGPQEAKADPALDRVFEEADVNNTNSIDRQELAEAMRVYNDPSSSLFSSFDIDADGAVSWQEAQLDRDLAHLFGTVDSDGSNALTPEEFNNAVALVGSDSAPGRS